MGRREEGDNEGPQIYQEQGLDSSSLPRDSVLSPV